MYFKREAKVFTSMTLHYLPIVIGPLVDIAGDYK